MPGSPGLAQIGQISSDSSISRFEAIALWSALRNFRAPKHIYIYIYMVLERFCAGASVKRPIPLQNKYIYIYMPGAPWVAQIDQISRFSSCPSFSRLVSLFFRPLSFFPVFVFVPGSVCFFCFSGPFLLCALLRWPSCLLQSPWCFLSHPHFLSLLAGKPGPAPNSPTFSLSRFVFLSFGLKFVATFCFEFCL